MAAEVAIWGIHAGRGGEADGLFLQRGRVALGWREMGDLGQIQSDREHFKAKVKETYSDKSPKAIANNAGQLYRFVHEISIGDLIVYPSKVDKQIHIGRVEGTYSYDPNQHSHYPHQRTVKWLHSIPEGVPNLVEIGGGSWSKIG